jgi:hypothetical protein
VHFVCLSKLQIFFWSKVCLNCKYRLEELGVLEATTKDHHEFHVSHRQLGEYYFKLLLLFVPVVT